VAELHLAFKQRFAGPALSSATTAGDLPAALSRSCSALALALHYTAEQLHVVTQHVLTSACLLTLPVITAASASAAAAAAAAGDLAAWQRIAWWEGPDAEGHLWLMIDFRAAVSASRTHGPELVARVLVSNVSALSVVTYSRPRLHLLMLCVLAVNCVAVHVQASLEIG
jgi:hypothetical protein